MQDKSGKLKKMKLIVMEKKQNMATWKEQNEMELERASYLINSDELIFEILDENRGFTKPLHMDENKDINMVQKINSPIEFSQILQEFGENVWWLI
jgi:hypothetical protein